MNKEEVSAVIIVFDGVSSLSERGLMSDKSICCIKFTSVKCQGQASAAKLSPAAFA